MGVRMSLLISRRKAERPVVCMSPPIPDKSNSRGRDCFVAALLAMTGIGAGLMTPALVAGSGGRGDTDSAKQSQFAEGRIQANRRGGKELGVNGEAFALNKTKPIRTGSLKFEVGSFKWSPCTSHSVRAGLKGSPNALHRVWEPNPAPTSLKPPYGGTTSRGRVQNKANLCGDKLMVTRVQERGYDKEWRIMAPRKQSQFSRPRLLRRWAARNDRTMGRKGECSSHRPIHRQAGACRCHLDLCHAEAVAPRNGVAPARALATVKRLAEACVGWYSVTFVLSRKTDVNTSYGKE